MQCLRELAQQLDAGNGKQGIVEILRRKAAAEYGESDVQVLGSLPKLFGWAEKGELYSDGLARVAPSSR